jgi:hypothetical protein
VAIGFTDAFEMTVGFSYKNRLGRSKPCLVGCLIMPVASAHKKRRWFRGCRGGIGRLIGRARSGSRLRLRKLHRVRVRLFQGFYNLWRQFSVGHLFFDPICFRVFRLEFRNLALDAALVNAAKPVVVRQFVNRIQLKNYRALRWALRLRARR